MKKVITSLFFFVIAAFSAIFAQKKAKSPIDGRIYTIKMVEDNKKKAEPFMDEASFQLGKFKSNFMVTAQFAAVDYEFEADSTATPPTYKFTAESKNDAQGRFSWEGAIDGDNISGTASIHKKGKVVHSYTFTGTWKNKKKARPAPKVAPAPVSDSVKKE